MKNKIKVPLRKDRQKKESISRKPDLQGLKWIKARGLNYVVITFPDCKIVCNETYYKYLQWKVQKIVGGVNSKYLTISLKDYHFITSEPPIIKVAGDYAKEAHGWII